MFNTLMASANAEEHSFLGGICPRGVGVESKFYKFCFFGLWPFFSFVILSSLILDEVPLGFLSVVRL